jgi:hypothetical protein
VIIQTDFPNRSHSVILLNNVSDESRDFGFSSQPNTRLMRMNSARKPDLRP